MAGRGQGRLLPLITALFFSVVLTTAQPLPQVEPSTNTLNSGEYITQPTLKSVSIECGSSASQPSNLTQTVPARHLGGFFTRGRQLQCVSQLQERGKSYLHVIKDVLSYDCGAKANESGFTITIFLTPHGSHQNEESKRELTCRYDATTPQDAHQRPRSDDVTRGVTTQSSVYASARPSHSARKPPLDAARGRDRAQSPASFQLQNVFRSPTTKTSLVQHQQAASAAAVGPAMSSLASIQLDVINADGSPATVIYPSKQLALELQTSHDTLFVVPVIHQCNVTNPQAGGQPFNVTILRFGCGTGEVLLNTKGFVKTRRGYATPFFSLPPEWTTQSELTFSCDVVLCTDVTRCHLQSCPPKSLSPPIQGQHDTPIVLNSQIVTRCPPFEDLAETSLRGWSYPVECVPKEGDRLNKTKYAAGDAIFASSWLAGHLHYVIIIGVLGLLIVVFMFATFCKMVAMQKQVARCHKLGHISGHLPPTSEHQQHSQHHVRETTTSENQHHDQMTQTPRPLPRTPASRSQGQHGQGSNPPQSRQGGDGAPVVEVILPDGVGPPRSSLIGVAGKQQGSGYDNVPGDSAGVAAPPAAPAASSGQPCAMTLPVRGSFRGRRAYDVPSHRGDLQHGELGPSVFVMDNVETDNILIRPIEIKSYNTSSLGPSFDEDSSIPPPTDQRASSIVEIKSPFNPPDLGGVERGGEGAGSRTGDVRSRDEQEAGVRRSRTGYGGREMPEDRSGVRTSAAGGGGGGEERDRDPGADPRSRASSSSSFRGREESRERERVRHRSMVWKPPPDHLASFTGGGHAGGASSFFHSPTSSSGSHNVSGSNSNASINSASNNANDRERGVVLGVNSLRRHLDRDNQLLHAPPRDRRPISTPAGRQQPLHSFHHHDTVTAQVFGGIPAAGSQDPATGQTAAAADPRRPDLVTEAGLLPLLRSNPSGESCRTSLSPPLTPTTSTTANNVLETTRL